MECEPSTSSDSKTKSVVNSQQTETSADSVLKVDNRERNINHSAGEVQSSEEGASSEKKFLLP